MKGPFLFRDDAEYVVSDAPTHCLPLGSLRCRVKRALHRRSKSQPMPYCPYHCQPRDGALEQTRPEKKYIHVPQQAAADFMATATPRYMRQKNEVS